MTCLPPVIIDTSQKGSRILCWTYVILWQLSKYYARRPPLGPGFSAGTRIRSPGGCWTDGPCQCAGRSSTCNRRETGKGPSWATVLDKLQQPVRECGATRMGRLIPLNLGRASAPYRSHNVSWLSLHYSGSLMLCAAVLEFPHKAVLTQAQIVVLHLKLD